MIDDPVVEEIRRHRQAHAAQYDYDIHKICEALREEERILGLKIVDLSPKPFSGSKFVVNHTS